MGLSHRQPPALRRKMAMILVQRWTALRYASFLFMLASSCVRCQTLNVTVGHSRPCADIETGMRRAQHPRGCFESRWGSLWLQVQLSHVAGIAFPANVYIVRVVLICCAVQKSKYKSLKIRAGSTVVIIASFIFVIYLGHVPLMMMILAIQVCQSHPAALLACIQY